LEDIMTADLLSDLFHFCALRAYLEQAASEQGLPDVEATRQRAFQLYEDALAIKNGRPRLNGWLLQPDARPPLSVGSLT
jgi:hypothetical protein